MPEELSEPVLWSYRHQGYRQRLPVRGNSVLLQLLVDPPGNVGDRHDHSAHVSCPRVEAHCHPRRPPTFRPPCFLPISPCFGHYTVSAQEDKLTAPCQNDHRAYHYLRFNIDRSGCCGDGDRASARRLAGPIQARRSSSRGRHSSASRTRSWHPCQPACLPDEHHRDVVRTVPGVRRLFMPEHYSLDDLCHANRRALC